MPRVATPFGTYTLYPRGLWQALWITAAICVSGFAFNTQPEFAFMAPPAGIAMAVLWRFGLDRGPAVWLGLFLLALLCGQSIGLASLCALGSTLGPALATLVLRREGIRIELDRQRDLLWFGALGVGLTSLVSASNTEFWLAASGSTPWAHVAWATWQHWPRELAGTLLVGVPLLTFKRAALGRAFAGWRAALTGLLMLVAVVSTALALHSQPSTSPWLFAPHLVLMALAVRSGSFVAAATACLAVVLGLLAGDPPQDATFTALYAMSLVAFSGFVAALAKELFVSKTHWQTVLTAAGLGSAQWDLVHGTIQLSNTWLSLLGRDSQSWDDSLQSFWLLIHTDDVRAVQQALQPLRAAGTNSGSVACRMKSQDDQWRSLELSAVVVEREPDGEPTRIIITARDITEALKARERQALSESLFQYLHEGLLITDAQHRVVEANPTFSQITGYARDDLLGSVPSLLRPAAEGSSAQAQQAALYAGLKAQGSWQGTMSDRRRDGEPCELQVTVSEVRDGTGQLRNHVLAIADVTVAHRRLAQLQRQAHFDELTHLPNRVRLAQMLQSAMQTCKHDGALLTVCYLDLDHFKPVNDQFGHEVGDRLLVELAERIRRSLRSWASGDDVVARIGGDEFVLLLRTTTLEESRHAVERVLQQISQPYVLSVDADPVVVTASIGATVFPLDGADAETLLRHADHAMYGAKQAGRNGYLFFDAEHNRRTEARFVALGRVQDALDAHEFRLYFQPKVDMRTGQVLGVEALLRWRHPEQGVVTPAQFLPLIENTGLSISVGNWVLQEGIAQLAQWLQQGLDITVSVNVSARHLQEPLFAQHLAGLLSRHQAGVAQHLIIEVLETTALADIAYTCALMEQCRALGVRFALDDFGTGYSTFTYLKRLPVDMLKIDRSFITHMLSDRQDLAIVEGVIGLSQTFGCSIVAEGVETTEQAQRLIDMGCHIGQGNGIAMAMPPRELPGWIQHYKGLPNMDAARTH